MQEKTFFYSFLSEIWDQSNYLYQLLFGFYTKISNSVPKTKCES